MIISQINLPWLFETHLIEYYICISYHQHKVKLLKGYLVDLFYIESGIIFAPLKPIVEKIGINVTAPSS